MDIFKLLKGGGDNSFITEMLLEKLKPMLTEKLPAFETKIKETLKAVVLEEGETNASYAITEYKDRIVLVLATYKGSELVRVIEAKPFDIAVNGLVDNLINSK